MGSDLEIQTVNNTPILSSFFAKDWRYGFDDYLPIDISGVCPFLCGVRDNILPHTLELCPG